MIVFINSKTESLLQQCWTRKGFCTNRHVFQVYTLAVSFCSRFLDRSYSLLDKSGSHFPFRHFFCWQKFRKKRYLRVLRLKLGHSNPESDEFLLLSGVTKCIRQVLLFSVLLRTVVLPLSSTAFKFWITSFYTL